MKKTLLTLAVIALVTGCNHTTKRNLSHQKTGKIIISREANKALLVVPAFFGYDGEDSLTLSSGEVKEIQAPVGKHEFFVKSSKMGKTHKITLSIKKDEVVCLKVKVDKRYLKGKTPSVFDFTSPFNIKKYSCDKI